MSAEPRLVQKLDGWYVEIRDADGVHSAGPTTREKAEAMQKNVQAALERFDRGERGT